MTGSVARWRLVRTVLIGATALVAAGCGSTVGAHVSDGAGAASSPNTLVTGTPAALPSAGGATGTTTPAGVTTPDATDDELAKAAAEIDALDEQLQSLGSTDGEGGNS